jgi:hypothetical protein
MALRHNTLEYNYKIKNFRQEGDTRQTGRFRICFTNECTTRRSQTDFYDIFFTNKRTADAVPIPAPPPVPRGPGPGQGPLPPAPRPLKTPVPTKTLPPIRDLQFWHWQNYLKTQEKKISVERMKTIRQTTGAKGEILPLPERRS